MMKIPRAATVALIALLGVAVSGCVTYYRPYPADQGVYYEQPYRPARAYASPLAYPYWSLDYFYFSRHYHPYSVSLHYYDPWYYPYPGWYYGYRPHARSALGVRLGYYYPWHARGIHYNHYRPWLIGSHFGIGFGHFSHQPRRLHHSDTVDLVRRNNARLHLLEQRQSLAARNQRPYRGQNSGSPARRPVSTRSRGMQQQSRPPARSAPRAQDRSATRQRQRSSNPGRTPEFRSDASRQQRQSPSPRAPDRSSHQPVAVAPGIRIRQPGRRDVDPRRSPPPTARHPATRPIPPQPTEPGRHATLPPPSDPRMRSSSVPQQHSRAPQPSRVQPPPQRSTRHAAPDSDRNPPPRTNRQAAPSRGESRRSGGRDRRDRNRER